MSIYGCSVPRFLAQPQVEVSTTELPTRNYYSEKDTTNLDFVRKLSSPTFHACVTFFLYSSRLGYLRY